MRHESTEVAGSRVRIGYTLDLDYEAVGTSDYFSDATQAKRERRYHNTYLLEFDEDGRCRSFTENYQLER